MPVNQASPSPNSLNTTSFTAEELAVYGEYLTMGNINSYIHHFGQAVARQKLDSYIEQRKHMEQMVLNLSSSVKKKTQLRLRELNVPAGTLFLRKTPSVA